MGETDDVRRREATPGGLTRVRSGEDTRIPWWVNVFFKAVAVLGIPGVMLAFYAYKDYRFEEQRLDVQVKQIATQEKTNILLERFEKVLLRVERKYPEDGNR